MLAAADGASATGGAPAATAAATDDADTATAAETAGVELTKFGLERCLGLGIIRTGVTDLDDIGLGVLKVCFRIGLSSLISMSEG